jgi:hypothetical protein
MITKTKSPTLLYRTINGSLGNCPKHFHKITGAEWIDEMRISPALYAQDYTPSENDWELMRYLRPMYKAYLKNMPPLFIQEGVSVGRHSLHALEPIKKGTVITEYLGEWDPTSTTPSSYRWGPIDGLHYRNFGGMADDGFPNMGAFHLYNMNDIPLRIIFVALEDIAAGEMLTINYGMKHSVKILYHDEYASARMHKFFATNSIEKCILRIQELLPRKRSELGWARCIELEGLTAKLQYLYNTPSAIINLLQHRILSTADIFTCYNRAEYRYYILGVPLNPDPRQAEVISSIEMLQVYLKEDGREQELMQLDWVQDVRVKLFFDFFIKKRSSEDDLERLKQETLLQNAAFNIAN